MRTAKMTIRLPDSDFAFAKRQQEMLCAKSLNMADFEDAVVVATAESSRCSVILSRNVADFKGAPVPVLTPEEFLAGGESKLKKRKG